MLQRLTIKTRLSVGFGALVLLIVALAASTTYSSSVTATSVAESKRTSTVLIALKTTALSVRLGRVMGWSFAATGDESYLKGREQAFEQYEKDYAAIQPLIKSPVGLGLLEEFDASVRDFEGKMRAFNALKAKGMATNAPDYVAAMNDVNAAAKIYAGANEKASNFQTDLYAKAAAATDAEVSSSRLMALIGGAAGLLVGIATAYLIARSIVTPLRSITATMDEMAKGDLSINIPSAENTDEIGDMARSLTQFKDGLLKARDLAKNEEAQREARQRRSQAIEGLTQNFEGHVSSLLTVVSGALHQLETTASSMSANSEQTSKQAIAVAGATEEASANVQTVATAAEELSASIQEIGRQVERSAKVSQTASEEANHTAAVVQELVESSVKIGTVINLISSIASQTNLLALNATIEAARAGDAGKGFAVVAGEVKNLANQTARATGEIEMQISAVQASTQDAVTAIGGIVKRISELNEISAAIAAAVEEQLAATGEIARNVQQAASGTQDVSNNISGVTLAAQETGSAAVQVLSSTQSLSKETSVLRDTVGTFLQSVRAA